MSLQTDRTLDHVQRAWDGDIVPALTEYIRIPAKSPMYDAKWAEHGYLDRAVTLITDWARARKIEGLTLEVVRLPGRTPVILMETPGAGGDTVLLYGHCDKQPEMVGWAADGGPWTPVRRGNRLFGRGAGDDGYAAFAALTAIEALQAQGVRPGIRTTSICSPSIRRRRAQFVIRSTARSMWPCSAHWASNIGDLAGMRMYSVRAGTMSPSQAR